MNLVLTGKRVLASSGGLGRAAAEVAAESPAGTPVGRYARVEEFAGVACFRASERASYVTGMLMRIDGGMIRGL